MPKAEASSSVVAWRAGRKCKPHPQLNDRRAIRIRRLAVPNQRSGRRWRSNSSSSSPV
jgi:hypothetical protein